jgi:hypothetical protein
VILSKNCKAVIKPIVELSFDTTINYFMAPKTQQVAEMNRFLTQHNFDKTFTCTSTRILNVSILYPIENTPDVLEF